MCWLLFLPVICYALVWLLHTKIYMRAFIHSSARVFALTRSWADGTMIGLCPANWTFCKKKNINVNGFYYLHYYLRAVVVVELEKRNNFLRFQMKLPSYLFVLLFIMQRSAYWNINMFTHIWTLYAHVTSVCA